MAYSSDENISDYDLSSSSEEEGEGSEKEGESNEDYKDIVERLKQRKGDDVWDYINAIGWGTKTTDYKNIGKALMATLPENEWASFSDSVDDLVNKVYTVADAVPDDNLFGSDDSWSDATAHIVGLGKESYDEFMSDPVAYVDRKFKENCYWFEENFKYSLHALYK
jgi:hypothetical protein